MKGNLHIISRLPQPLGGVDGLPGRGGILAYLEVEDLFSHFFQAGVGGVDKDEPVGLEQPGHPVGEGLDVRAAGPVGLPQAADDVRLELRIQSQFLEPPETIGNVPGQDEVRGGDFAFL